MREGTAKFKAFRKIDLLSWLPSCFALLRNFHPQDFASVLFRLGTPIYTEFLPCESGTAHLHHQDLVQHVVFIGNKLSEKSHSEVQ